MKHKRIVWIWAFAVSVVVVASAIAWADGAGVPHQDRDPPDTTRPRVIDDVDRELFGDDPKKPPTPGDKTAEKPSAVVPPKPVSSPKPEASKPASSQPGVSQPGVSQPGVSQPGAGESIEDALAKTVDEMRNAGVRIGRADCGVDTQQLQKRAVARLDAMLQEARKRCGACQGTGGPSESRAASGGPSSPPKASASGKTEAKSARNADPKAKPPEPGGKLDPQQRLSLLKQLWGNLPERQRDRFLQLPSAEEFLPEYELLIEDYFRRLAEDARPP